VNEVKDDYTPFLADDLWLSIFRYLL